MKMKWNREQHMAKKTELELQKEVAPFYQDRRLTQANRMKEAVRFDNQLVPSFLDSKYGAN
jgi:hypothetical protein